MTTAIGFNFVKLTKTKAGSISKSVKIACIVQCRMRCLESSAYAQSVRLSKDKEFAVKIFIVHVIFEVLYRLPDAMTRCQSPSASLSKCRTILYCTVQYCTVYSVSAVNTLSSTSSLTGRFILLQYVVICLAGTVLCIQIFTVKKDLALLCEIFTG